MRRMIFAWAGVRVARWVRSTTSNEPGPKRSIGSSSVTIGMLGSGSKKKRMRRVTTVPSGSMTMSKVGEKLRLAGRMSRNVIKMRSRASRASET